MTSPVGQTASGQASARQAVAGRVYRIVIRDLLLMCRIGVYAHERMAPQRVRINVEMAVAGIAAEIDDRIDNVLNYEFIVSGIHSLIANKHINLVETLAEEIADLCLMDPRTTEVRVRVEKLDVYAEAASVGVEVERRACDRAPAALPASASTVVKLGGSLMKSGALSPWLERLSRPPLAPVVIVPGGGPFADTVRDAQAALNLGDGAAHRMAIGAMEQYGRMLAALQPALVTASSPAEIVFALSQGRSVVWIPPAMVFGRKDIAESWDVTSDSLAAWFAREMGARRLVLVKSAALPAGETDVAALVQRGLVDPAFPRFADGSFEISCVSVADGEAFEAAAGEGRVFGTRVGV